MTNEQAIEQAKELLRECTDKQKEQFAIIGVLSSARFLKTFLDMLRGEKYASN